MLLAVIALPNAMRAPAPAPPVDAPLAPTDLIVLASGDDGNAATNAVDGDVTTRWSVEGDGEWLRLDLGGVRKVTSVAIAFYRGDERRYTFDIQLSLDGKVWDNALSGGQSSGATRRPERFTVSALSARYLRYVGHGNTIDRGNGIAEVQPMLGQAVTVGDGADDTPAEPSGYVRASVANASASAGTAAAPARHAIDNNLATGWAANGPGQWLRLDLGTPLKVGYVKLAIWRGAIRRAAFKLQVSTDAKRWTTVWSGGSGGLTEGLEVYDFRDVTARYVRYLGHDTSSWVTEFGVHVVPVGSERVHLDRGGRLDLARYPNGDQVPDFSHAGYRGGGVALPDVPVRATVSPGAGDDGGRIQAAIATVGALTPDDRGVRGAVLLTAGAYEVEGVIRINVSGVILRGEGDDPEGTVIKAVGTTPRDLITISGTGNRRESRRTRRTIADSYVQSDPARSPSPVPRACGSVMMSSSSVPPTRSG